MSSASPQRLVVVIFGATGTAGTGALRAALADERVTEVRAVTRRLLRDAHPKVRNILCTDFADLARIADAFDAVDICLFCLGTSVRNVAGEEEYRTIHVEYAVVAAHAMLARSPAASFVYLSGAGTNRRSRMMWARVKAEAEDQLAALPLARLVCVRPGGIPPARPSGFERWLVAPLIKAVPSLGIDAEELGRAMLAAARDHAGPPRVTMENRALKALAVESARAVSDGAPTGVASGMMRPAILVLLAGTMLPAALPSPHVSRDSNRWSGNSFAGASLQADSIGTALQHLADSLVAARPRLPGLLIAVESKRHGRTWTVAAGVADVARKTPLKPDQPVRIASNTKTYVAAAVLRLVEQGRLSLSDPLTRHLPAALDTLLRRDGYPTDVITIEQVLSHRAGFAEHPAVPSYVARLRTQPRYHWTREEQVTWLVDSLAPVGPPGAQFRYSDTGYTLLGAVVERYTGQSLGPAVRALVGFERLGLRQTWWETMEPAPAGIADRAHQYMGGFDAYDIDPSFDLYGGGGIVASMSDLAHFVSALVDGRVFAQQATLDTMLAPRSREMAGYGLGIFGTTARGLRGRGHSGFWGTSAMAFPDAGITVAVAVTEQGEGRLLNLVMSAVLERLGAGR